MKRILSCLLALILIMSLAACGSAGKETPTETPKPGKDSGSAPKPAATAGPDVSEAPAAEEAPVGETPFFEAQELYDQDGLKISVWYEDDPEDGKLLFIECENSTDKRLLIDKYITVNEYMLASGGTIYADPHDSAVYGLKLEWGWYDEVGLTEETIGQIGFSFVVSEDGEKSGERVRLFEIDEIAVKTANYDRMKPAEAFSGAEVYNEGGLRVLCDYADKNSSYGDAVLLYAENNSGRDVRIDLSDVFLNGRWVSLKPGRNELLNGKKFLSINGIEAGQMEKYQIASAEDVKVTLCIRDLASNVIYDETEPFAFSPGGHAAAAAFSDPAAFAGFDAFTPEYAELGHTDMTIRFGETTLGEFCTDLSGKSEQLPDALHGSVKDAEMIEAGAVGRYQKNDTYFIYNPSDRPAAPSDCILIGFAFDRRGSFANGTYCGFFEGENPADGVTRILGEPYDISFYPNAGHGSDGATVYIWRDAARDHILIMTVEPRETKSGSLEGPFKVKYINRSVIH